MKFLVSSSVLYKHLVALYGVIVSNPVIPILENFLFEITNGKLKVTASDLQTSIITEISLDIEGSTSIAVPAKILLDTLKNLPDQPISFDVNESAYSILIKSNTGQYNLAGENAADFPRLPEITNKSSIHLPSDILKKSIQQTIIATSHDDLKPAINGVYMVFQEGNMTFVATDIHRLVRYTRNDVPTIEQSPFILPRKTLVLLNALLPIDKQEVQITFGGNSVYIKIANLVMVSRLIDERYPDYENVIPKNNNNTLVINRLSLLTTLRRIIIYTNKITHQVKFTLKKQTLEVLAEDFNFDNKAKEQLDCVYVGESDLEIGFNGKSLIELLHNLTATEVTFSFSQANKAVIIVPGEQEKGEATLVLIMPITLN